MRIVPHTTSMESDLEILELDGRETLQLIFVGEILVQMLHELESYF